MQIDAASAATTISTTGADRGTSALKSEDFFKILISELRNQDPLEPNKTADMIGQVAQIRSIELNGQLSETLDTMTRQQRTAGASEMLGKFVSAVAATDAGSEQLVSGLVTAVNFNDKGEALLELDTGVAVRSADVRWVSSLDEVERRLAEDQTLTEEQKSNAAKLVQQSRARAAAAQPPAEQPGWFNLNIKL